MNAGVDIARAVEALLFAAPEPLSAAELARRLPEGAEVDVALATVRARYTGRGVELTCVADRWCFRTAPDLAPLLGGAREEPRRLSKAALETLAIIAYHQPVTRAEIESIRGVALSPGTLDTLMTAGLVRFRGRRRTPGRPVTLGTTPDFLELYGLASLDDLPGVADLRAAGLLSLNLPEGFSLGPAGRPAEAEDALDEADSPEFYQDALAAEVVG